VLGGVARIGGCGLHAEGSASLHPLFAQPSPHTNPQFPKTHKQPKQIGAVLTVSGRHFELQGADEATLKIMEADTVNFPVADPHHVQRLLLDQLGAQPEVAARLAQRLGGFAAGRGRPLNQQLPSDSTMITARQLHGLLMECGVAVAEGAAAGGGGAVGLHSAVTLVRALTGGGRSDGGDGGGVGERVPTVAERTAAEVVAPVADVMSVLGL